MNFLEIAIDWAKKKIFATFIITVCKKFANMSQACKLNFIEEKKITCTFIWNIYIASCYDNIYDNVLKTSRPMKVKGK